MASRIRQAHARGHQPAVTAAVPSGPAPRTIWSAAAGQPRLAPRSPACRWFGHDLDQRTTDTLDQYDAERFQAEHIRARPPRWRFLSSSPARSRSIGMPRMSR
jgi:hypothetical protein